MPITKRRRLLAALVLVGLAPIETLAQSHSNSRPNAGRSTSPGSGGSASSSSAAGAAPLPDCVIDKAPVSAGITVSSKADTGNVVSGFVLELTPPASALRLTGLEKTSGDSNVTLQIACQYSQGEPDGIEIGSLKILLPEFHRAGSAVPVELGSTILKMGTANSTQSGGSGVYGSTLTYNVANLSYDPFQTLAASLKRGGVLTLTAPALSGAGSASLTYTVPRLAPAFALVKPKTDKLASDAAAGLCKIPAGDQYMAKFCTTAAIEVIGLERRCWELRALHDFRDWMRAHPRHFREAQAYADGAPDVVRAIGRRPDARRIWLGAYFTGILPAAAAARLGWTGVARLIYRALCLRLVRLAKA